jgi:hypothetical protein
MTNDHPQPNDARRSRLRRTGCVGGRSRAGTEAGQSDASCGAEAPEASPPPLAASPDPVDVRVPQVGGNPQTCAALAEHRDRLRAMIPGLAAASAALRRVPQVAGTPETCASPAPISPVSSSTLSEPHP